MQTSNALSVLECDILRNEFTGPKLRWLSDAERWDRLQNIWCEVKLLTGCVLYDGEMISLQLSMLERFLITSEKYASLTPDEIRQAFYMNAQGAFADSVAGGGDMYRHYNKELNAEFIGDVLNAYLRRKAKMYATKRDLICKALNPAPAADKENTVLKIDDWKILVQQDYDLFRLGAKQWIFGTSEKYMFLRRCELIFFTSKRKWQEWYQSAFSVRERSVRTKKATNIGSRIVREHALNMYEAIRKTGMINHDEHQNVIYQMRRMVYMKFFDIIAGCGINKIFSEIKSKL